MTIKKQMPFKKLIPFLAILFAASLFINGCEKKDDQPPVMIEPIVLDCNFFKTDQVLENDPNRPVDYIVPCVAQVTANIVIKAGVVIEFEDDAGLNVSTGSLRVEGTATSKVVFTGKIKVKGSWRGIYITSQSVNNILDHAVVSYAGGNSFNSNDDRGNVICYNCKITVTNTEISNGKEHGFHALYSSTDILAFENNIIKNNDKYPIYSRIEYGYIFSGINELSGNGNDYIYLEGGRSVEDHQTWYSSNVPFFIDGNLRIVSGGSLTLFAGADVRFEYSSSVTIEDGAFLAANGEAGNRVILTGLAEQPGSWKGIINRSGDPRNVIDFAEIAYAGGGAHNSNGDLGTIIVWSGAYQQVTNTILRDAAANAPCAINAPYNNETLVLSDNTVINIDNEECQ
ncbi:MAG: hypothetical protein R6W71_02795 [Bacteroidales bacterium]|jgi:hypothetical protein